MLSSLKRLTKHSAIYGVGHIITRLVNFLLLPLYTNKLEATELGVWANIFAFLAFMTPIYTYGIDAAFLRFFILSDDVKKRRQVFSTAFWAVAAVAAALTILIYESAGWLSPFLEVESYARLIQLAGVILFFDALTFLPFLYLRAEEKSHYFIAVKFVNVLINVGLNILFIVKLNKGVEGIFWANIWASALTLLMLSSILLRQIGFQFNTQDIKQLLSFGLPFLPSVLSVVLLDSIDKIIMSKIAGLHLTGIYSAGFKLGMFMSLFVAAFRFAWHPFFLSTSKQENAKEIFAKVLTYFTAAGACLFLVISFFIDEIVRLRLFGYSLIGEAFWPGTRVVPLILLAYLLYGVYVNFIVGIFLEKKTKVLPLITGAGVLVNVLANLALIPGLDLIGAGLAKVLGYLVMCVLLYWFAQRAYRIPYEFGRLLKLAGITAALFFLGDSLHGQGHVFIRLALVLGFPVALFVTGFFERREIETLKGLFNARLVRLTK